MEKESLIRQAKKGDKAAFALLYETIYTDLYRVAYYMLSNSQDAEDAVSETIIDAYKGICKLKDEKAFKNWIFKILYVKCKRKMAEYYERNIPLDEVEHLEANAEEKEVWLSFKMALSNLNYEERCIVTYHIVGGYNSKEIAKILDINRNTVRSKLSRALEKIRLRMEG